MSLSNSATAARGSALTGKMTTTPPGAMETAETEPVESVADSWDASFAPNTPSTVMPGTLTGPVEGAALRKVVVDCCGMLMKTHHGPMHYLMSRFSKTAALQAYADWLWKTFPPDSQYELQYTHPLPECPNLHISMLSFNPDSSPREPTSANKCMELADHIMIESFLTQQEPLMLSSGSVAKQQSLARPGVDLAWPSAAPKDTHVKPFSIGHHKSAGRVTTLHLILTLFMDDDINVEQSAPALWQSVRTIKAIDMKFSSALEETFSNFRISHRGAIRRPPSVLSWCIALGRLQKSGESDAASIVKTWNKDAPKSSQLVGGKALSVKNLLEKASDTILEMIILCNSRWGWEDSPFTDDCFSSKKIWAGSHWRNSTCKAWTARMVVSRASNALMFKHILQNHEKLPEAMRKQMTKENFEELALKAAVVSNLGEELVSANLPQELVQEEWLDMWVSGDIRIDMEISSILAEKDPHFTIRNLSTAREMLEKHSVGCRPGTAALQEHQVLNAARELESKTFELTLKQLEYDCNVWKVFQGKVEQWERRMASKARGWLNP